MHILYATDGSDAALAGAHLLARLPLSASDRVTILTVLAERGDRHAEAALGAAHGFLQRSGAFLEAKSCGPGSASEEILRAAEAQPTDLVVVGARGLGALTRFLIGSTSERVARHASCSVLVARPLVDDLRQVILSTDGSEGAVRAADWLKRFPLPEQSRVHIVMVMEYLEGLRHLYQEQSAQAEQHLKELAASFTASSRPSTWELPWGDAADCLIRTAEERQADLVVVGARGMSAIERFLLGSVSEKVMRHAPCSVLVVK